MRLQWGFLSGPCDRLTHTMAHSALVAMLPSNAGTGDLGELFVECSSTAFGLASPPVSPKRSRHSNHCRQRKTNPRAPLSHCVRSSTSGAGKKPSRLGGALSNSLSARSLGMVERLIPNSEQCALCRSGRAKVAAVGCRARHPLVNDRRCAAIGGGDSAVGPPSSQRCRSSWPRLSASSARHALL